MASFSRSQKLRQASVAERIAALQAEQEAEADKLQRELREKQARERAELEEQLKREAKVLEEEEKRRKSAERKRREVEVQEVEEVPRTKKARLFEEKQQTRNFKIGQASTGPSLSMVRSSTLKKKPPPTESGDRDLNKHYESDGVEEIEEEQERVLRVRGKGKVNKIGLVESTQNASNNQSRCVRCAEANVQCHISEGNRRRSCRRCVNLRRKCVPEGDVDPRVTSPGTRTLEILNALQQAAEALTENSQVVAQNTHVVKQWTEEMKKVSESLVKEGKRFVGQPHQARPKIER